MTFVDKTTRVYLAVFSGALLLILIGCIGNQNSEESTSAATSSSPTDTIAVPPSETVSLLISEIAGTDTPSGLDGSTKTPSPSQTLTGAEVEANFIKLLKINEKCPLPCWWGLNPGEASVEDLFNLASSTKLSVSEFEREDGTLIYEVYPLSFDQIFNRVAFFQVGEGETIDWIWVNGQTRFDEQISSGTLLEVWEPLSPENVMRDYGAPSDVRISSVSHFGDDPQPDEFPYWIGFYYRENGFIIRYEGVVENTSIYNICPTTQNNGNLGRSIGIYIQSPTSQRPLEDLHGEIAGGEFDLERSKFIEEVTIYSPEELFSEYTDNGNFCFEIPQSTWP